MFCTKCGAEIELQAKFCSKCGNPVESASAPVPGPASAAPNPALAAPNPAPAASAGMQNPGAVPVRMTAAPNPAPAAPVRMQNAGAASARPGSAPMPAAPVQMQNGAPGQNGMRGVPVPPPAAGIPQAPAKPKGKVVYGANTLVGIIGAFAVFVSLFLPCATASVSAFSFSVDVDSISFIELMREGDAAFVSIAVLVSIGLAVLFQMVKCPKISLIGVLGMLFGMGILVWAISETKSGAGGWASVSYGIGFWIYIVGMVLCVVGAFLKKKRL